jgi:predicted amidophosphoribosyltransferase
MAREFLSILPHRIWQLYSNLMPIPCRLCGTMSQHQAICKTCLQNLPQLGDACPRCALPNSYLIRSIDIKSQASIPFKALKKNIQHVFKFIQTKLPADIAIIDDVVTTGHTANAAVKQLRQAGAITTTKYRVVYRDRHFR